MLPFPQEMQLTGRVMSLDTVLVLSGSWNTATELIMSSFSLVAGSSASKYSSVDGKLLI